VGVSIVRFESYRVGVSTLVLRIQSVTCRSASSRAMP
jgi:hypothetical protein